MEKDASLAVKKEIFRVSSRRLDPPENEVLLVQNSRLANEASSKSL